MSDSRKYLIGATATIVAARIAARAHEQSGGDLRKPAEAPSLRDEFVSTYKELEAAFEAIGDRGPQKAWGDKHRRSVDVSLLGD